MEKRRKKRVTVYLPEHLVEAAVREDLSLSALITVLLKEYFERHSVGTEIGSYMEENGENGWTRRDSNPGPPACEAGALPLSYGPTMCPVERSEHRSAGGGIRTHAGFPPPA